MTLHDEARLAIARLGLHELLVEAKRCKVVYLKWSYEMGLWISLIYHRPDISQAKNAGKDF